MAGRISEQAALVARDPTSQKARISAQAALVARDPTSQKARISGQVSLLLRLSIRITSLTPDHGLVGVAVTIAGDGFGASQGAGGVTFGGTAATVTSWSDTEVTCTVPSRASGACSVVVTNDTGAVSLGASFTVEEIATATGRSFCVIVG